MTKIYDEHLRQEVTTDGRKAEGIITEHSYCGFLREHGYAVNRLIESRTVESSSSDKSYLIQVIETLALPKDHAELDIVEDTIELTMCSCDDWSYRQCADISESGVHPDECGECKHVESEFREIRAQNDDDQRELIE